MKILLHYLKPHKWLVTLVLTLAAINIGFSLFDPIILGKFINILFGVIIGVVFVFVYAALFIHWSIPIAYLVGITVLTFITNKLSKKIKSIQKNIVGQTTALAGSTTESLRNIELVKSLGLTRQEVERLNKNTYKILGLELTKVKRIRSISFIQGTFVNTLRQVILFI